MIRQMPAGNIQQRISNFYSGFWRGIYRFQSMPQKDILGYIELGVAAIIALFPGIRSVTEAADGRPQGLILAMLMAIFFAVCSGGLLFQSKISDGQMKFLLSPFLILWLFSLLGVGAALKNYPNSAGGACFVSLICFAVMWLGMSHTYSPTRERPKDGLSINS